MFSRKATTNGSVILQCLLKSCHFLQC